MLHWKEIAAATLLTVAAAIGDFAATANAQQLRAAAKCGQYYDRWQIAGAPATMLAMFGLGHEVIAAHDCLSKNDTDGACEHYRRVLAVFERLDPQFAAEHVASLRSRMREVGCL